MNSLESKYMIQIELNTGMIINKEFIALNDLEAIDKAYIYAKNNFKEEILDIKVV